MAGFSQGGGIGLVLSRWMAEGDPGQDILVDGRGALRRVRDAELHRRSRCPRTTAAASGSPIRTRNCRRRGRCAARRSMTGCATRAPCSARISASSTRCGSRRKASSPTETPTYRRSEAFPMCARNARRCAARPGSTRRRTTASTRSPGAARAPWLDRVFACRIPKPGRLGLAPMLNPAGRIVGDLSIACLADGSLFHRRLGLCRRISHALVLGRKSAADVLVRSAAFDA